MALTLLSKTVAASATPEAISGTAILCDQIVIQVKSTNTGKVFVGDSSVSSTVCMQLEVPQAGAMLPAIRLVPIDLSHPISLSSIYIGVAVNGNGVNVFYEPV